MKQRHRRGRDDAESVRGSADTLLANLDNIETLARLGGFNPPDFRKYLESARQAARDLLWSENER